MVGAKEQQTCIWRWSVRYEYLFLKILLPRQKGLLPSQKGLGLRLGLTLTLTLTLTITDIKT